MSQPVPASMTAAWKAQAKIGGQRPVVRATIQAQNLKRFEYDTAWVTGGTEDVDKHKTGHYTSILFGDQSRVRELPNIKSCSWERSIGQDAATCTITLLNTELVSLGSPKPSPASPDEFDRPGHLTYNRGSTPEATSRWGYVEGESGWNDIIVPDMIVKTYEGYGCDRTQTAQLDPNLVQSGTWMIDKVTYGNDGTITLEMRDLGRMLLDQIVFPPVVPKADYPLSWIADHSENVSTRDAAGGSWVGGMKSRGTASSSNDVYIGKGFTNKPFSSYVGPNGGVDGHHASHVLPDHEFPRDYDLYWKSTGQDSVHSFVWWQFDANDSIPLAGVRLRMYGGPYRAYISVHDGTKWIGKKKIPWKMNGKDGSPGNVDIGADIPFVKSVIADRFFRFDVIMPRKYNAKKIRITLTRLQSSGVGEHSYYGGLHDVQIYTADSLSDLSFQKGETLKVVGNYGDFTHIVKTVCAWGGFYWPPASTKMDFQRVEIAGTVNPDVPAHDVLQNVRYVNEDRVLASGRVWGDFMRSGTKGVADLTVDMFDKKPLMDVINYVRDLLGFNFFIDEAGAIVWRMPNIWSLGNYLNAKSAAHDGVPANRGRYGRTSEIVTLDENETLLGYQAIVDSTNIRDRIFVGNAVGGVASVIKGFNPYPLGLMRVAGWTDQQFASKRETRVMADMISARSMFTYRVGQAVIPGYPKIQVDDQVRIFERVTSETYYHYVMGIKSELDMDSGEWTYTLDTHWLGEDPNDIWAVKVDELDTVTQQYLSAVGYTPDNTGEDNGD